MSRTQKTRAQMPSTAEAIKMASAAILNTTTTKGYPLGSAVGTGSVMERNSDMVAMSVVPLVFTVHDALRSSEGLELLSIEWDLERAPGSEFLPEQLLVVGSTDVGVSSYACVLAWEQGIADPFKTDEYIRRVSKKLSDIEAAIISSRLEYETTGIEVLRRFNDRLNRVFFVDLLDRRFKASHDSFQLRPEDVEKQFTLAVSCRDEFRALPPGVKILRRKYLKFYSPSTDPETGIDYFQHRILTPTGIDTLSVKIPELGQAILNEVNTYAYSQEEGDIVSAVTDILVEFLGTSTFTLAEIRQLNQRLAEFMRRLIPIVETFSAAVQEHINSGKVLTLSEHRVSLTESPEIYTLRDLDRMIVERLLDILFKSLEQAFPLEGAVRAWQMKGVMNYFVAICQRVVDYFDKEITQYLVVSAAYTALSQIIQNLRQSIFQSGMTNMDQLLFQKFYDELHAQLNAIFDKKTFQHQTTTDYSHLMGDIINELSDAFKHVESWGLVDFNDVAQSTKTELRTRYGSMTGGDSTALSPRGQALENLLSSLEHLVVDVVPGIANTLLSKPFINSLVERCKAVKCGVPDAIIDIIESYEQPEDWKAEVRNWMSELRSRLEHGLPLHEQLTRLLEFIHEQISVRVTSSSVLDRIQRELRALQSLYDEEITKWTAECRRIDEENRVISAHNQRRDELLTAVQSEYERDMRVYQQSLSDYNQRISESSSPQTIQPPPIPESLESRIRKIESMYPLQSLKPLPPRPEPPEVLTNYSELNSILSEQIAQLNQRQSEMAQVFSRQLDQLKTDSLSRAVNASIDIRAGFLDYVMDSVVRRLGRVFPRVKRVYLRDAVQPEWLYLVTYEHHDDEIVISAGDNTLR